MLDCDIFQLDYSFIENLFQSEAGAPHPNQKAHLSRQIEVETDDSTKAEVQLKDEQITRTIEYLRTLQGSDKVKK